ncbi:hypothetical protein EV401DRAFT_2212832 [Pisolithus croceorrhizus]|nr:hypothetical protein EV401DRAFT_2212832 [Pisolithus croceorrhizus]
MGPRCGKWSGDDTGGTDPALRLKARRTVKDTWMTQNWGSDSHTESTLSTPAWGMRRTYGDEASIFDTRSDYENVWFGLSMEGITNFCIALKLGDLNSRLGENKEALEWWARAIHMTQGTQRPKGSTLPIASQTLPSSPLAQYILASTLFSLPICYFTSQHLKEAQKVQETALSVLRPSVRSYPFQCIVYDTSAPLALTMYATLVISYPFVLLKSSMHRAHLGSLP